MPASEKKRLALLNRLIEVLGREEAEVLMDSLPPVDWHQLATKDDVFALKEDFFALKEDVVALEQRLRIEMHAEFKMLRAENKEFQGAIALQLARQTRTMVFTMLGLAMPTWGAILAVGIS